MSQSKCQAAFWGDILRLEIPDPIYGTTVLYDASICCCYVEELTPHRLANLSDWLDSIMLQVTVRSDFGSKLVLRVSVRL